MLADLGADVIKVERPGQGDDTRSWGPPFVAGADGDPLAAAYYHAANRGKRSIAVDITTTEGQGIVRRLAERSDVLIENFKRGGLAAYGLDYDSLAEVNPRLVYCSITGFGHTGPYADRAGYDFIIQAMGGIMDLTGEADGEPQKPGVAYADLFTGLYSVIGIQAAVLRAARSGRGCHLDMSLLDTQVAVLANQALNFQVGGTAPRRMGNAHPNIVPYQVFACGDGHVVIACGNDGQFRRLCAALSCPAMADVPDYATNAGRVAARETLVPALEAVLQRFTRAEILERLEAVGVPAGPINSVADVMTDPQVLARQMAIAQDQPLAEAGSVPGVRSPLVMDEQPCVAPRPPPALGEHTAEILAEIGWTTPDDALGEPEDGG